MGGVICVLTFSGLYAEEENYHEMSVKETAKPKKQQIADWKKKVHHETMEQNYQKLIQQYEKIQQEITTLDPLLLSIKSTINSVLDSNTRLVFEMMHDYLQKTSALQKKAHTVLNKFLEMQRKQADEKALKK